MCWVIYTRFSSGVWLHDPKNDKRLYIREAEAVEFSDYEEAVGTLMKNAEFNLESSNFRPNRLYQVRSKRIYVVIYNKRKAGFVEMQNLAEFLIKNRLSLKFFKRRWRLDYKCALAFLTSLDVETGSNKIIGRKLPVVGKMYMRNGGRSR